MGSAGNYTHSKDHINPPCSTTLENLIKGHAKKGVSSTYCAYADKNHISHLTNGDGEISLKNGSLVVLSRIFRQQTAMLNKIYIYEIRLALAKQL
jgi:hypothetical protein